MKKTLLFKQLALAAALAVPLAGNGQRLLEDNFEYADGAFTQQNGWEILNSGNALNIVSTPQLSYANYQEEGVGKSMQLGNSGQDAMKTFTTQTAGSVYAALLVNFSEVQGTFDNNGEYFFHLGESSMSSYFGGRVFAKQSSDGTKMHFGVSKASTGVSAEWTTEEYALNETHLVVVKYTIAAGEENDEVALFIDPTSTTEPTPDAVSSDNSKADLVDIGAVGIRQGAVTRTPLGYVGALRVSTTWAALFNGEGEEPEPSKEPTLTTDPATHMFIPDNMAVGETYSYSIQVKGENLQGDVTVSIGDNSGGEVTTEHSTIAKADAEAGFDFTFTVKPLVAHPYQDGYETITFASKGVEPIEFMLMWSSYAITQAATIAEFKEAVRGMDEYELFDAQFKLTGEVMVTHAYTDDNDKACLFVEDATGGLKISESFSNTLVYGYKAGDKLSGLPLSASVTFGSITAYTEADFGAPLSRGNEVTPTILTLADLKANGARYEGCLVKVEEVTITPSTPGNFGDEGTTPIYLKQAEGDNSTLYILPGADFIGKTIPESARSITGISTNATGSAIAPRSLADIDADFDEPGGEDPGTEPGEPGNETEVGENLLSNPSFEENSSNLFGAQFTDWSLALGSATVESEIMQEGEAAIRITGSSNAYLEQEVRPGTFTAGDAYRLTIHYYIVQSQGDDDVQLACHWDGIDVTDPNAADLKQNFTGAVNTWETKTIRTVVPEGATSLYFHMDIPAGAEVIFDNFSLYKLEAVATGLEAASENGLSAWAEGGVLYLGSDRAQTVDVYSLNGVLISRTNLTPGVNALALPAGAYVLKADGHAQKVLVK